MNECDNCGNLNEKLQAFEELINQIPLTGGGLVPYTDGDSCSSRDTPSMVEFMESIENVLCCLITLFCSDTYLCNFLTPCIEAIVDGRLDGLEIKNCTDVINCIADWQIKSCSDVIDCVENVTDQSAIQGMSRTLGIGCDGSLGLFKHVPSEVDVISGTFPSIVENPWTDPTWALAPAGGGAVYATKVFHIADFTIPNYPACAGTQWRAMISFGLDHIPSGGNAGPLTFGYLGYNPKLNGADPLGGIMQVGDHWAHNTGKKGMGGSPNFCAEFLAIPGNNSFDLVIFVTSDTPAYNEPINLNSLKLQVRTKLVHI